MKFIALDVQGFLLPEFTAKELSITNGQQVAHYLFKCPKKFCDLQSTDRKTCVYLQNWIHGIRFDDGVTNYNEISSILNDHIVKTNVDRIYVRGLNKYNWLMDELRKLDAATRIVVINLETNENCPNLEKDVPMCMFHNSDKKYMCSMRNVYNLYAYVSRCLP